MIQSLAKRKYEGTVRLASARVHRERVDAIGQLAGVEQPVWTTASSRATPSDWAWARDRHAQTTASGLPPCGRALRKFRVNCAECLADDSFSLTDENNRSK